MLSRAGGMVNVSGNANNGHGDGKAWNGTCQQTGANPGYHKNQRDWVKVFSNASAKISMVLLYPVRVAGKKDFKYIGEQQPHAT